MLNECKCASKVLGSPVLVEVENGDLCGSKGTGVTDVLDTVEVP